MWVVFIALMWCFSSLRWKILPSSVQPRGTLTVLQPLFVSSKDWNFFVRLLHCFVSLTTLQWAEVHSYCDVDYHHFHYHYLLHFYHLFYPTQSLLLSLFTTILYISYTCFHRSDSHLLLDIPLASATNIFPSILLIVKSSLPVSQAWALQSL